MSWSLLKLLRPVVLPIALLSAGIASAHVSDDGIREAGFSRVKVPSRERDWRSDSISIISRRGGVTTAPSDTNSIQMK